MTKRTTNGYEGQTCVLAYSGGLDTSVAVAWLRETYGFEVVTVTGDLGTVKDLAGVQRKALASGANRLYRCAPWMLCPKLTRGCAAAACRRAESAFSCRCAMAGRCGWNIGRAAIRNGDIC